MLLYIAYLTRMQYLFFVISGKIISLLVGVFVFRYLPISYRLIFAQVFLALISECLGELLIKFHRYNSWVFNLHNLADMWLTGGAAMLLLGKSAFRRSIPYLLTFLTGIWAINIYNIGFYYLATWFFVSSCILLVLLYIAVLFNKSLFTNKKIIQEPATWLSMSVILYFGCNVPYFGLYNYLIAHNYASVEKLWFINLSLDFLRYPLIAIAFFLMARQKIRALKII